MFLWIADPAFAVKTNSVELGRDGAYDGRVRIERDASGRMTFIDDTLTSPVALGSLAEGVAAHGALRGLLDDDHPQYQNAARHGLAHTSSFDDALPTGPDARGNTTLGAHLRDGQIHLNRAANETVSGAWTFSGTPEMRADLRLSAAGEAGTERLVFENGSTDAQMAWNPSTGRFEFNFPLYAPDATLLHATIDQMQFSGPVDGGGTASLDNWARIAGIDADHLVDRAAAADISGAWNFLAPPRMSALASLAGAAVATLANDDATFYGDATVNGTLAGRAGANLGTAANAGVGKINLGAASANKAYVTAWNATGGERSLSGMGEEIYLYNPPTNGYSAHTVDVNTRFQGGMNGPHVVEDVNWRVFNNGNHLGSVIGVRSRLAGYLYSGNGQDPTLWETRAGDFSIMIGSSIEGAPSIAQARSLFASLPSMPRYDQTTGSIANGYCVYLDGSTVENVTNPWGLYQAGAAVANYFQGPVRTANEAGLKGLRTDGEVVNLAKMGGGNLAHFGGSQNAGTTIDSDGVAAAAFFQEEKWKFKSRVLLTADAVHVDCLHASAVRAVDGAGATFNGDGQAEYFGALELQSEVRYELPLEWKYNAICGFDFALHGDGFSDLEITAWLKEYSMNGHAKSVVAGGSTGAINSAPTTATVETAAYALQPNCAYYLVFKVSGGSFAHAYIPAIGVKYK
ncbi:MAG: hypothetical protein NTW86_31870 [Candidatus Sumerlaeota bacterium]|nr:hypothetical protein [Candidatus Sumerlaeota bacterium]